ncbi:MAG: hypothetical protein U0694_26390 [Anaerolineae bacterium]
MPQNSARACCPELPRDCDLIAADGELRVTAAEGEGVACIGVRCASVPTTAPTLAFWATVSGDRVMSVGA